MSSLLERYQELPPLDSYHQNPFGGLKPEIRKCTDEDELIALKNELDAVSIGRGNWRTKKAERRRDLLRTIDETIEFLEYPAPSEWKVSKQEIESVLDTPVPVSGSMYRDEWLSVYTEYTADELLFIQEALNCHYQHIVSSYQTEEWSISDIRNTESMLLGLAFTDSDIELDAFIDFCNKGGGPDVETVKPYVEFLADLVHPYYMGVVGVELHTVKTNRTNHLYGGRYEDRTGDGGWYNHFERVVNVRTEWSIEDELTVENRYDRLFDRDSWESARGSSTTIHEFGHFFHNMIGMKFSSIDMRDIDDSEWFWETTGNDESIGSFSGMKPENESIIAEYKDIWMDWYSQEDRPVIRDYQCKNPAEFFCVCFENWVLHPRLLQEELPSMHDYFEKVFKLTESRD